MNKVVVFDRLNVPGWAGQEPLDVPTYPVVSLQTALQKKSQGPLLTVGYAPKDEKEKQSPRLLKSSTARFARRGYHLTSILVDIDFHNHAKPPVDWHNGILEKLPDELSGAGWYRTPHGMRLMWELEEPVPLILADSATYHVHDLLNEAGIKTDSGTADWTRMFYLPYAMGRDLPHSDFSQIGTLKLDLDQLEQTEPKSFGEYIETDRPTDPKKPTRKELKPVAKLDEQLADELYRGEVAAKKGERHGTLLRVALKVAFAAESNDPRYMFRALARSAQNMDKPLEELWRICEWSAAAFDGYKEDRKEQRREALDGASDDLDCDWGEVFQRLIVDTGKEFYVWDSSKKSYSEPYKNIRQLRAAAKRHCPILGEEIAWGNKTGSYIFRDYSSPANNVVYSHAANKAEYDAEHRELIFPCSKEDPSLKPQYSVEIDKWLKKLFGDGNYRNGLKWLAAVPVLDKPICALYLQGPNSIGKGMLAAGIARIWSKHCEYTDYAEISEDFQSKLLDCPLVVADEKVPQRDLTRNDSSVFRRLVGNGTHSVNQKGISRVTLKGYPRVLITANNADALDIREDLDQEDLEAIKLRVGYINRGSNSSARKYLQEKAREKGVHNTFDMTKEWVEKKIAEHILWLRDEHDYTPDERFLVEGWHSAFTDNLAVSVGSAAAVAETLVIAIDRGAYTPAVRWFDGSVYVHSNLLAQEWETIRGHEVDRAPGQQSRLKALRSLSKGNKKRLRDHNGKQRRYWKIPATILARLAEEHNLSSGEKLLEAAGRTRQDERQRTSPGVDQVTVDM